MAAEGKLRVKLKARVEAYGGEIRAVSWLGRRFAPDVMVLWVKGVPAVADPNKLRYENGAVHHPFIETKTPGGKPTVGQAREHERMRAAGCVVLVISTEAQLDEWLPPL